MTSNGVAGKQAAVMGNCTERRGTQRLSTEDGDSISVSVAKQLPLQGEDGGEAEGSVLRLMMEESAQSRPASAAGGPGKDAETHCQPSTEPGRTHCHLLTPGLQCSALEIRFNLRCTQE